MKTDKYVIQLLGDIEELMVTDPPCLSKGEVFLEDDDFTERMLEIEEHILNEQGADFAELSGIREEHLPGQELLSDAQVDDLVMKLLALLEHFQFIPVFPEKLPVRDQYAILKNNWNKFKVPLLDYKLYYDFCEQDEKSCPFPGYCGICEDHRKGASSGKNADLNAMINISTSMEHFEIPEFNKHFSPESDDRYITGIFNYCDRRCGPCKFTMNCYAYVKGREKGVVPDEEVLSESWMNELEDMYESIIESVIDAKLKLDIHAAELAKNDGFNITFKKELLYKPEAFQLLTIAEYYTKSLHEWISKTGYDWFREQVGNDSVLNSIIWLQASIAAKMFRSFMGEEEPGEDPVQNDCNGSAKVAIMHIKESLSAWCWILYKRDTLKNVAMKFAILLNDMLVEMENRFPLAGEFIRPGFDQDEKDWEYE